VGKQVSEVFFLHQETELKQELDIRLLERSEKLEEKKRLKAQLEDAENILTEEEKNDIEEKIKELKKQTAHFPTLKDVAMDYSERIIKEVGIPDARGILKRYPHELSGGMRQRVMIAMALSCNPALLIADEPTTALDVTIQAQILDLMKGLIQRYKTSILIITHDLGIIAELCDRIAVMYSGNIVEYATAEDLFKNPRHPYTKGLIGAIPSIEKKNQKLQTIRGMVPNLIYPPSGCRFHPRCDYRMEICDKVKPVLTEIAKRYYVACHLFDPKYKDSPKYAIDEKEDASLFKV
jgi:oligopeptide/dipeptide ABC transporter ATP-binding protein